MASTSIPSTWSPNPLNYYREQSDQQQQSPSLIATPDHQSYQPQQHQFGGAPAMQQQHQFGGAPAMQHQFGSAPAMQQQHQQQKRIKSFFKTGQQQLGSV